MWTSRDDCRLKPWWYAVEGVVLRGYQTSYPLPQAAVYRFKLVVNFSSWKALLLFTLGCVRKPCEHQTDTKLKLWRRGLQRVEAQIKAQLKVYAAHFPVRVWKLKLHFQSKRISKPCELPSSILLFLLEVTWEGGRRKEVNCTSIPMTTSRLSSEDWASN